MKSLATTLFATVLAVGAGHVLASPGDVVELYKNPSCGCCGEWAKHMEKNGFKIRVHEVADAGVVREQSGIPATLGSCHTAKVGGYAIEGHVPAADVKRLLKERPKAVGLSAPGMPQSAPGMDSATNQPYDVLLVKPGGKTEIFAKH